MVCEYQYVSMTVKKNCFGEKENMSQVHALGNLIWGDLRTFWSNFSDLCVIKRFVRFVNVYSPVGLLRNVQSPKLFAFCASLVQRRQGEGL